jgi:hypothetical protein
MDKLKARIALMMSDIPGRAGDQIIDNDHLIAASQVKIAEVRSNETGSAG